MWDVRIDFSLCVCVCVSLSLSALIDRYIGKFGGNSGFLEPSWSPFSFSRKKRLGFFLGASPFLVDGNLLGFRVVGPPLSLSLHTYPWNSNTRWVCQPANFAPFLPPQPTARPKSNHRITVSRLQHFIPLLPPLQPLHALPMHFHRELFVALFFRFGGSTVFQGLDSSLRRGLSDLILCCFYK